MPCRSFESIHRLMTPALRGDPGLRPSGSTVRAHSILTHAILVLVTLVTLVALTGATPSTLEAQEVRLTGGTANAPDSELIGGRGWGIGVRYFHWEGLGVGIESDRFSNRAALIMACPPDPSGCVTEPVDFSTDLNTTSFIALLAFGAGDDVRFRVGAGRVAGTVKSENGVGRQTGAEVEVPGADRGTRTIAWSRGADGNVIIFEVLYRLPVPGPLPLSAYGTFRRHDLRMEGCGAEFSFFCGALNHREFQLGLATHLFPRGGP